MYQNPRRLRRPEERVGTVTNADLPPPETESADHALVQRLLAQDDAALHDLARRYYSTMLRLALNFVATSDEAEDVIQETWVAVLNGIHNFEGRSSFKTWLFRILLNRARTHGKRAARMVPMTDDVGSAIPARERNPEEALLNDELRAHIEAAIAELPRVQRLVITLRDVEGLTPREVCEALDLTEANQRVLLHRARMKVRGRLAPYV